ncbi:MAG TPA: CopG family transcriptional regulator [Devosia sp.]|nr:CopG family transcriptional regulator [Devosia sp.]
MSESTSIKLADGLRERVQAIAQRKKRSANALMNEAIAAYVRREESEEEFNTEARRRVREYEETGLHVTHDEAMEWLQRRARGEKISPPKAHR